MGKILVTGGAGYIGSHTIVDLIEHGVEVVSIDNFSNSYTDVFPGIEAITGKSVLNESFDLCDIEACRSFFSRHLDIEGIVHFAAYKYVNESVSEPIKYYHNNIASLLNLLQCVDEFGIKQFVFSSSCSVYGNAMQIPVTEETPFEKAECPYAQTKVIGEQIVRDFSISRPDVFFTILRYFNPAGAHRSGKIGEHSKGIPQNIVPRITGSALGIFDAFVVMGSDYNTRDGSCIRDYIHVMDIAHAHTLSIQKTHKESLEIYNLGTGNGVSVFELIHAFEEATGQKLSYKTGPRRHGDVAAIYANNSKAMKELCWTIKYSLPEIMQSAWKWEAKKSVQKA